MSTASIMRCPMALPVLSSRIDRAVKGAAPVTLAIANRMDVYSAYKPLRNRIARLGVEDSLRTIWGYSQFLQIEEFRFPRDIETNARFLQAKIPQSIVSEWELELLAKEVILNSGPLIEKSYSLKRWAVLGEILNGIKALENEIYGAFGSTDNVLVEMIRVSHRQFQWRVDRPNAETFIRYYLIFSELAVDRICLRKLNLSVRDIYLCGMACLGSFLSHAATVYPMTSEVPTVTQEKVDSFLSFTSRSVVELKGLLKEEQRYDANFAYSFNSLRRFPLVLTSPVGGVLLCPIPTLLFWRISKGLYYELVGEPGFANAFGSSFQQYVGKAISRACSANTLGEIEYGPKALNKKSVDWIVYDDSAALFIECKARRMSQDAKSTLTDLAPLTRDIDGLAASIVQIYKTTRDYLSGQYPHFPFQANRKLYPVVVTLENWHVMGPVMVRTLDEAVSRRLLEEGLSPQLSKEMPYSIWWIGDLEDGFQLFDVVSIASFMDGKLHDAEMRQWEWRPYINRQFGKTKRRKLFGEEYEAMFSDIPGLATI